MKKARKPLDQIKRRDNITRASNKISDMKKTNNITDKKKTFSKNEMENKIKEK